MTVCKNVFCCSHPLGLSPIDLFPARFVHACSHMESEGLIPAAVCISGVEWWCLLFEALRLVATDLLPNCVIVVLAARWSRRG
jgi:hypothetical protein